MKIIFVFCKCITHFHNIIYWILALFPTDLKCYSNHQLNFNIFHDSVSGFFVLFNWFIYFCIIFSDCYLNIFSMIFLYFVLFKFFFGGVIISHFHFDLNIRTNLLYNIPIYKQTEIFVFFFFKLLLLKVLHMSFLPSPH